MNYFDLYQIPVALKVDTQAIKQQFYALSRKYHPDFYANASEQEQDEALELSSLVNKAFKTFSNPSATIQYVLMEKGLLEEEEKYKLPNDFLMDMLELNEEVMDAKMEDDTAKIADLKQHIANILSDIYEPVKQIVEDYKEGVTTQEALLQVKDFYFKQKYLERILDGMQ